MKEFLKYLLAWPAYVIAFIAVGYVLMKIGEFLFDAIPDYWQRRKARRNKK